MGKDEVLQRIQLNSKRGEELVSFISNELPRLKEAAKFKHFENVVNDLMTKNVQLKSELEYWKKRVVELEIMNNIKQYPISLDSSKMAISEVDSKPISKSSDSNIDSKSVTQTSCISDKNDTKIDAKKEEKANISKPEKKPKEEDKEVNVSRLDLRIGRILSAKKHPDAESLYVEDIDVGEEKPRTVVSGLVKFVPLEEMQNRLVVVLCNLKPAKMRGIISEAMVMCASTPEKVEILTPPADSLPGDRVICDDCSGEPDAILAPKKKIFEQVAPDLKTNNERIATYKASQLKVLGKGVIQAATLSNVQIK